MNALGTPQNPFKLLDLFSGIGGFSLGLERTGGFKTVAFCEIEEFPRRVLAKHWPEVPCYHDIRELTGERLAADGIAVDAICGGFPCQDISIAGQGAGLEGDRSVLWYEYARLIGELRPRYVIVENVSALLHRGLDAVLGCLASLGFDAEWHCIPASAVGAPHERDRIWIVAYTYNGQRVEPFGHVCARRDAAGGGGEALANTDEGDRHRRDGALQMGRLPIAREVANDGYARRAQWGAEPAVGRVAHGVSHRVDRVGSLGNAVVPQIPELIGNAIIAAHRQMELAA
ncbi:DNA cytosine methyltransferase [Sphingomonas baiyangensis]|uniref:Cytosine-specific methyltransferase n=1 Tax=Sphingomonas baiyangensis TaxID=2572576 RepID=A0A4U1L208_9SPHN|nr:DNA cytosine methyltransferase [Sphingomonas baiyangensis]TKD50203.1 DNA cytosine methyltransferase [Sphingomonas baiyangensis]